MGETRVDLLHLLEDLRDAYPGPAEETILTEIVANSLDSGATLIAVTVDAGERTLTLVDDGRGMRRRDLARYHDVAATTKTRGEGIGFAGVGIKMALLVCQEVLTETRQRGKHVATTWALASRYRAPWKWVPPPGLVGERGTALRLTLDNALSLLLDPGFVETGLRRHFRPLFDATFAEVLGEHYPAGVAFVVNGERLGPEPRAAAQSAPIGVKLARRRRLAAAGYMIRDRVPLPEERRGIAISTLGKVIKRGWDWLGLTPVDPERVGGLIEAPALAECLTLNKVDFIRAGARGASYLAYRKALQEAVARQLAEWGDTAESGERERRRAARPVERDLEAVLMDLAADFPLLASLVERRAGGQRRLPMAGSANAARELAPAALAAAEVRDDAEANASEVQEPGADGAEHSGDDSPAALPRAPAPAAGDARLPSEGRGERRPGRYGLAIQFEERPDEPELARLVESTVWINEAHPAYRRAAASRAEGYHIALASALALASLAVEPAKEHAFVIAFLSSWGAALDRRRPGRRRPRGRGNART
jgi:hypothetical protein